MNFTETKIPLIIKFTVTLCPTKKEKTLPLHAPIHLPSLLVLFNQPPCVTKRKGKDIFGYFIVGQLVFTWGAFSIFLAETLIQN